VREQLTVTKPLVATRFFVEALAEHGSQVALIDGSDVLTYADLAGRVDATAAALGAERRLVLIAGAHRSDVVTAYLGALAGGHVVLLLPGDREEHLAQWVERYEPDVVVRVVDGTLTTTERRPGSLHTLHPDLALLLSTSGSTGSAKLVRLSYGSLHANAESIAEFLAITPEDRAITTLPMEYCYGLSVLHSHLLRGASIVLTDISVVDRCFWDLCQTWGVTSLAGVPYTYELLERVGFFDLDLPTLRYLTQAGGRMPAEQVRRFAAAGAERGWQLFVMYGQTEATARMAYLPPELAASNPGSVGIAIPGGQLEIDPETGELVFVGPNVMLGYAHRPADLRLGRTVTELRTGDLARIGPDGLFEIVGRQSRFAKVFGLRIDLDVLDARLASEEITAWSTALGDALVVVAEGAASETRVRAAAAGASGLPTSAIRVLRVEALPRHGSGKLDGAALLALARSTLDVATARKPAGISAAYASVLGRDDVTDDSTFVSLGGDSLSYVELSVRLEAELGSLPPDWHTRPIVELRTRGRSKGRIRWLDTTVAMRATAIVMIVCEHSHWFHILGGAHVLLVVAGYNFARFRLTNARPSERTRAMWDAARRLFVPSALCILLASFVTAQLGPIQALMLNDAFGPPGLGPAWRYWFVECLIQVLVGLAIVLRIPWLHRAERRFPFLFPCVLVGLGLLTRFQVIDLGSQHGPSATQSSLGIFWLFALGWAAAQARHPAQRALLSAGAICFVHGFFGMRTHELVVTGGILILIWVRAIPLPEFASPVRPLLGVVASSSLYIYLVNWQVLDVMHRRHPVPTAFACLVLGIAVWRVSTLSSRAIRRHWRTRSVGRVARPAFALSGRRTA
jgi:acyl-CoA synthetase (AMP-forming)/AMP-acid ligase II